MNDADDAPLVVDALRRNRVDVVFAATTPRAATLSRRLEASGLPVVETLHEQTAAFAAEGWARVSRRPGVVILDGPTALPRAITGLANAFANGSPLVVLDERASVEGDVDGVDHGAMSRTITRSVSTTRPAELPEVLSSACATANRPPRGPVLVEILGPSRGSAVPCSEPSGSGDAWMVSAPDTAAVDGIAAQLEAAERPVLVAGGSVYWHGAEDALRRFAETLRVPVIMNGMGRGTLPSDHEVGAVAGASQCIARGRSRARCRHASRFPPRLRAVRFRPSRAPV